MVAPAAGVGGGGGEGQEQEQEFDICNDEGFVYKVPSGLYPDAAPSSTQAAAGPDPEIAGLRRRRRALLRLRAKRLRDLSRWDSLASELLAPPPAPGPPASQAPPASPNPVAATATAASASVLDDLIAQADAQAELLRKASQLCDEINALCDANEAAILDDIATLPVWGNPRELMLLLQSPNALCDANEAAIVDDIATLPVRGNPRELMLSLHSPNADPGSLDEGNGGFQSLDSQQGRRAIGIGGDKRIQSPSQCKRCLQFGCNGKMCCETHAEPGDELAPPVLTENRKRKGAVNSSSSNGVAAQAPEKPKRQKAPGSKSTPSGTPVSTTKRKAATPRAPDTSRSPGPTTRRRAAAQLVSPRS